MVRTKERHQPTKIEGLKKSKKPEPKWFEKSMEDGAFEEREGKDGKIYGRYNEWKDTIWIGPYKTSEELDKVIQSYLKETKKPFGKRKEIKNVHSIIIEDEKFWK
jgi:hypothetical protein